MEHSPEKYRNERHSERVPARLLVVWEGQSGKHEASISDVTAEGCYLNTRGAAAVGEIISFKAPLLTGEEVELRGRVVHHNKRLIGFGVKFEELSSEQRELLAQLVAEGVEMLKESRAS
ncbi:MAG TPA: PilZ domain-containing protein [Blastocatellia bacterium]|nr:PilZ domain-containing protein [Blastocatellia bacterium]